MNGTRQLEWSQLPQSSRIALEAAALLDQPFAVAAIVQLDVAPADLDPLFDSSLLREVDPAAAEFADPALRNEIIASMPWSRKRRLCEQLAEILQTRADALLEAVRLYQAAHAHRGARLCLIRLAESAGREGKYTVACDHLRQALDLWPAADTAPDRSRILREFARCARHAGRIKEAQQVWNEILGCATGSAEDRIEAHHQLSALAQLAGDHRLACEHLRTAAELTEETGSKLEAARRWFALSSYLTDRIRLREALEAMLSAREAASQAGAHDLLSECLGFEGLILAIMGRHEEASRRVDASLELAVRECLTDQVAVAYRRLANLRDYAADYPGARDAHLRAIALCREQGSTSGEQTCLGCLSYAFFRTGEWKRALETARKVLRDPDAHPTLRAMSLSIEAIIAAFRGHRRTAETHLDEALLQLRRNNVLVIAFYVLWAKGLYAEFFPQLEQAGAKSYDELRAFWHETEDRLGAVPGIMSATAFYADRGDAVALTDCAEILEVISRDNSTEETRAAWHAVTAEVAWVKGGCTRALEAMQAAVTGYDRLGTPLEMALVRRRLARMLVRDKQPRRSEEVRREAREIAQKLGLRPLLELLQHDVAAGGDPMGASGESQTRGCGLTPRQRQILALIARGMTDKEIAAHFDLSPRTVEMHVAIALDRLNCRTRSEAASRALEQGWL